MQYIAYLRWSILTGLFFTPFLSLLVASGGMVPSMFFPYITGKNFVFRILIEILLALYVLLALRDPKYRPRASLLMWAMLGFLVWMGVATIFSVDATKSFWSNFERMEGYLSLLHLFSYFVIAGAVLTVDKLWERFLQTSVGVSLLQGCIALLQILGWFGLSPSSQSGARADGTFGNATYLAVFMLLNFFLTLFLLARHLTESRRPSAALQSFYGTALVVQGAAIFFTQTRGAILGLIGGLIIAALFMVWRARTPELKLIRKISIGALVGIAVLVVGFLAIKDSTLIQSNETLARLAAISFEERTTLSRFLIWSMAYQGFVERPLTGWGQENFNFVFNKYYTPEMYDQEEWFDRAHNQFLDWLIAGGLPAFLLYLSFYLLAAWAIFRSQVLKVPEQAVLLGLLAGYGFHNLFVFDNLLSAIYFFTILAFAHSLSRKELPGWMFLATPLGDRALAIVAPIAGVALILCVYQLNAAGMARAQTLLVAIQPSADLQNNLTAFEKVLLMGPLGKQEATEQLLQLSATLAASSEVSPELKQRVFDLAHAAGEELLAQRQSDTRIELIFASFLSQYGRLDEALSHLLKAQETSPQKQRVFFQLGSLYLQGGDLPQAVAQFKHAFELEPRYDAARIFYASSLYYAGQGAQADALLQERYGTLLVDDQRILQVYADTKQYDRAIGIWQMRVEKSPDDAQTHIGLATAYFLSGNNDGAITELEIAARQNPSMAAQIRSAINQIKDGTLKP